ncbi:Surfeit locus protein 2 putative isoform 3 [Tripterygium wilfordii]|uniref:Surfeit locus protein 2 putative isoform 3 n=1 Tax=Tripterygium wilfordii TaxID=458696 RepID=A0A7J7DLE0_TRIWF|nr:surfeit locus protein 2-like [Tripterygium wilfordii]KAF5746906.1 Surfeit locus protein 2 putative isoform 3 [Tripterygium wilfordii]
MATCGEEKAVKEGSNLLGPPSFQLLENGRFRCLETGHEMVVGDKDSYSQSKRCRLGLIDFALSNNKPPLNMFKQSPLSRSKLICKLTGDTINKSEEHIWKHINGKRFLNKLEQKETGKLSSNEIVEQKGVEEPEKELKTPVDGGKKKKKNKQKEKRPVEEIISEMRDPSNQDDDSEEADFWMPPAGERWDFDDGADRWGSCSEAEDDSDEEHGTVKDGGKESEELSLRTKRMAIEIGPSSSASRKKKAKKNSC